MINKAPFHLEANEIRNDRTTSFETKNLLIDTLKKESGYQKDLELSDEKRSQHREKQDILTKLKTEGQSPEFVDRVRKSFYPEYDPSHKKYDTGLEQVSEGTSEDIMEFITENYNNRIKGVQNDYMKTISELPLSLRKEGGINIINLEGFGEFGLMDQKNYRNKGVKEEVKTKTPYELEEHNIEYFFDPEEVENFTSRIEGCELMGPDDFYKLINLLGDTLARESDRTEEELLRYVDKSFSFYIELGATMELLSIILGDSYSIPFKIMNDDQTFGKYVYYIDGGVGSVESVQMDKLDIGFMSEHDFTPLFKINKK